MKASHMKVIFYSHANETPYHKKGFALSLVLEVIVFGTWKCETTEPWTHDELHCRILVELPFVMYAVRTTGAPNGNFRENICLEDDLRTRIFGTFVVKFFACLPLLGFSNIYRMV